VQEEDKIEKWSLSKVTKNTLFLVKNGERVPLDGVIQSGHSSVNESQVTGESLPVQKSPGDSILAGSLLLEGTVTALSTSDSKNSTIGRIISLVEHAQASKAPIQKLVDKVCAVFVPMVLLIALGTWIGWWMASGDLSRSIMNAVAVLVIACPCALGLATPSAIVVGIGEAAKKGILVRDASVLETAHKVTIALLDKTGTLTEGKPEVQGLHLETASLRSLLFRVSTLNSHPLSAALSNYFLQNPEPNDRDASSGELKLVSIPGKGVLAEFNEAQYFPPMSGKLPHRNLKNYQSTEAGLWS
jgi:Cu+-exporting ATPase